VKALVGVSLLVSESFAEATKPAVFETSRETAAHAHVRNQGQESFQLLQLANVLK